MSGSRYLFVLPILLYLHEVCIQEKYGAVVFKKKKVYYNLFLIGLNKECKYLPQKSSILNQIYPLEINSPKHRILMWCSPWSPIQALQKKMRFKKKKINMFLKVNNNERLKVEMLLNRVEPLSSKTMIKDDFCTRRSVLIWYSIWFPR